MFKELVSIVICTHNRKELLVRAIRSVQNQTYKNIEIIVTDDCSTDGTEELVSQLILESEIPILYRRNERNMGACYTRNKGIEMALGKFYTGLDDDDTFSSNRISDFIENWDSSYSFICANINVVDKSGCFKMFFGAKNISKNNLLWYNDAGNQIFTLLERVRGVGMFCENLRSAQDVDLWLRLIYEYGNAKRINSLTYNLHIDHDLPRITTSNNKLSGLKLFYERHKDYMNSSQKRNYLFKIDYWKSNRKLKLSHVRFLSFRTVMFCINLLSTKVCRYADKIF
ncbi:glycosyltransferase [Vibrio fluvialis]|uniref:glycosyltransferase n=1 Tax=Vibrio fluvialis TaxID=676 RepID=UPI001F15BC82|nr:glycosyltransferase [Vibrio fluvialis]MCE7650702.1 glycosyltransferase [Vibrio fluvialis]